MSSNKECVRQLAFLKEKLIAGVYVAPLSLILKNGSGSRLIGIRSSADIEVVRDGKEARIFLADGAPIRISDSGEFFLKADKDAKGRPVFLSDV